MSNKRPREEGSDDEDREDTRFGGEAMDLSESPPQIPLSDPSFVKIGVMSAQSMSSPRSPMGWISQRTRAAPLQTTPRKIRRAMAYVGEVGSPSLSASRRLIEHQQQNISQSPCRDRSTPQRLLSGNMIERTLSNQADGFMTKVRNEIPDTPSSKKRRRICEDEGSDMEFSVSTADKADYSIQTGPIGFKFQFSQPDSKACVNPVGNDSTNPFVFGASHPSVSTRISPHLSTLSAPMDSSCAQWSAPNASALVIQTPTQEKPLQQCHSDRSLKASKSMIFSSTQETSCLPNAVHALQPIITQSNIQPTSNSSRETAVMTVNLQETLSFFLIYIDSNELTSSTANGLFGMVFNEESHVTLDFVHQSAWSGVITWIAHIIVGEKERNIVPFYKILRKVVTYGAQHRKSHGMTFIQLMEGVVRVLSSIFPRLIIEKESRLPELLAMVLTSEAADPKPFLDCVRARFTITAESYQLLSRQFDSSKSLFQSLVNYDQLSSGFPHDLFCYSWMLFLLCQFNNAKHGERNDDQLCIQCVLFVTSQPGVDRRSIGEVSLRHHDVNAAVDWIYRGDEVSTKLCSERGFDYQSFAVQASIVISSVEHLVGKSRFLSSQSIQHPGHFPWNAYEGSFVDHPQSYLPANLIDIARQLDFFTINQERELDGTMFLDRTFLTDTPRTVFRTPCAPRVSKAPASKLNLSSMMKQVSKFGQLMPATPLTANPRSLTLKNSNLSATKQDIMMVQRRISDALKVEINVKSLIDRYFPAARANEITSVIKQRICEFIAQTIRRYPSTDKVEIRRCEQLYYSLLSSTLRCEERRLHTVTWDDLLCDNQFHVCLILLAYEFNRLAFKLPDCEFDFAQELLCVEPLELCLIGQLVRKNEQELMGPKLLNNRVMELEERFLETWLWKGSRYYDIMAHLKSQSIGMELVTKVMQLHEDATKGLSNEEDPQFPGFHVLKTLKSMVLRMADARMKILCKELALRDEIANQGWEYMKACLETEFENRFIQNSNIDRLMICCLHSAARVLNTDIKFQIIIEKYRTQPQVTEEMIESLKVGNAEHASLVDFHNNQFIPKFRPFLGPRSHPEEPSHHGGLPTRTPLTRKLSSCEILNGSSSPMPIVKGSKKTLNMMNSIYVDPRLSLLRSHGKVRE
ncbi:hypothetical protein BJ742DRAFT_772326 [Cladochytrium replicatum]|nr:hypothetical protein BJ742DRAFT_772326 [Cladochytrium replicatum]